MRWRSYEARELRPPAGMPADLYRVALAAVGRAGLPHPCGAKYWPPPARRWFAWRGHVFASR